MSDKCPKCGDIDIDLMERTIVTCAAMRDHYKAKADELEAENARLKHLIEIGFAGSPPPYPIENLLRRLDDAEKERLRLVAELQKQIVWADDQTPFSPSQIIDLLVESSRLRANNSKLLAACIAAETVLLDPKFKHNEAGVLIGLRVAIAAAERSGQ